MAFPRTRQCCWKILSILFDRLLLLNTLIFRVVLCFQMILRSTYSLFTSQEDVSYGQHMVQPSVAFFVANVALFTTMKEFILGEGDFAEARPCPEEKTSAPRTSRKRKRDKKKSITKKKKKKRPNSSHHAKYLSSYWRVWEICWCSQLKLDSQSVCLLTCTCNTHTFLFLSSGKICRP